MTTISRKYTVSVKEASDAVLKALKDNSFEVKKVEGKKIFASSSPSLLSWGEEIIISIDGSTKQTSIQISSEPVIQLTDWGKSEENIKMLFSGIERILREG